MSFPKSATSNQGARNAFLVTGKVEEERIVGLRVLDQPMHCPNDVCLCGLAQRIGLVVGQDHHVLSPISVTLIQEGRHLRNIIDATPQLVRLSNVVNTDEKGFPTARTRRILVPIVRWSTVSKTLTLQRRPGWQGGWLTP